MDAHPVHPCPYGLGARAAVVPRWDTGRPPVLHRWVQQDVVPSSVTQGYIVPLGATWVPLRGHTSCTDGPLGCPCSARTVPARALQLCALCVRTQALWPRACHVSQLQDAAGHCGSTRVPPCSRSGGRAGLLPSGCSLTVSPSAALRGAWGWPPVLPPASSPARSAHLARRAGSRPSGLD